MTAGSFKISPGKKFVSRHRYLVTSKPVDVDTIEQHWKNDSKPMT